MSTCGEVGSDVHALVKEFAIRRVEHNRSDIHSNESRHLAEGAEVVRFRRGLYIYIFSRHFHSARVIISANRKKW